MKVLATTDGSEFSMEALRRLGGLIPHQDVELILLSVFPNPNGGAVGLAGPPYGVDFVEIQEDLRKEFGGFLEQGAQLLAAQGFQVRRELREGDPASEILDFAQREAVDMIVVGSHGRTGLARFFLGSVSSRIVSHAPASVLVIRHAAASR